MLIFSLSDPFVKIRDCTPLYADSFDLNAHHSQVLGVVRRYYVGVVRRYAPPFSTLRIRSIGRPFQNLSDAHTHLPRTPVRASVDARSCICRTPVPVSMHMGVGWKLYYDAYRIRSWIPKAIDTLSSCTLHTTICAHKPLMKHPHSVLSRVFSPTATLQQCFGW